MTEENAPTEAREVSGDAARSPRVTRRQALAVGGLVAAAGAGGLGLRIAGWWNAPAAEGFLCLSEREAELIDSMGEALFPPGGEPALSGADAGLARFLDGVIDTIPEGTHELLRSFLHALDDFTRVTHFSGFCELPTAERTELLGEWTQSPQYLFRSSVASLVLFLSMGYCLHPEVKEACGWVFPCGYGE